MSILLNDIILEISKQESKNPSRLLRDILKLRNKRKVQVDYVPFDTSRLYDFTLITISSSSEILLLFDGFNWQALAIDSITSKVSTYTVDCKKFLTDLHLIANGPNVDAWERLTGKRDNASGAFITVVEAESQRCILKY